MHTKRPKIIITIISTCLLFFVSRIFAATQVNTTLGINPPPVDIIFTPPYSTGFYTSGNVDVELTGIGIVSSHDYYVPDNQIYTFYYRRGTGPYDSGAGFSSGNTRTQLSLTTGVSRIDKTPPEYFGVTSGATYTDDITINFSDNNASGCIATLNGTEFTNGSIIVSTNGTYTLVVTDIAGNSTGATFTLNKNSGGGGGGGGGGGDPCISRSCNSSYYDALCGPCPTTETGVAGSGVISTEIVAPHEPVITPEETKEYPQEMLDAYKYAYALGITTKGSADEANLDGPLIRKQLAKMISEYAVKVVGLKPDNNKKCDFSDVNNESEEMQYYMRLSCKLGLMGLDADGATVRPTFMPNEIVNRAQFGTVFSRLIFGDTYNLTGGELTLFDQAMNALQNTTQKIANLFGITYVANIKIDRYTKHLNALKQTNIMTKVEPFMQEIRGYVMIMMMRADKNGVIQTYAGEKIPSTNK